MAEFPMMPFWGERFFGDANVMVMRAEDIGAHLSLCWFAWQHNGRVPKDAESLMMIARVREADWHRVWGRLKACYDVDKDDERLLIQGHVLDLLNEARSQKEKASEKGRIAGLASVSKRGYRHIKHRTPVKHTLNPELNTSLTPLVSGGGVGVLPEKGKPEGETTPPAPPAPARCTPRSRS